MTKIIPINEKEKGYPKILKEIPDYPKMLFCRGNTDLLSKKHLVSIVGSRKATEYGLRQTRKIAYDLSGSGVVIVSGLALGIDSEAHKGALDAGGKTVAVLGSAIDNFYPAANEALAERMLKTGNLIISEYPEGSPTYRSNFPLRNRIIAGMSKATIVCEAARRSGALITAFLALDYNREVYALPGNIDRYNSKGTNYLIKKGAGCITSSDDILEGLGLLKKKQEEIKLDENETKVAEIIQKGYVNFDEIIEKSGIDASRLNIILATMELKGVLSRLSSGEYAIG